LLQATGWLPASYAFNSGVLAIVPSLVEYRPLPTLAFLAGLALIQIVMVIELMGAARKRLLALRDKSLHRDWADGHEVFCVFPYRFELDLEIEGKKTRCASRHSAQCSCASQSSGATLQRVRKLAVRSRHVRRYPE
jgi:hypothetical protein